MSTNDNNSNEAGERSIRSNNDIDNEAGVDQI